MSKPLTNRIRRFTGKMLLAVTLCAASLLPSACVDEVYNPALSGDEGITMVRNADGSYGPYSFSVSFDSETSDNKSRGNFVQQMEIHSAWVGMFDSATGDLIADTCVIFNFEDGDYTINPGHSNDDKTDPNKGLTKYRIELRNVFVHDNNPTVYLAGVANLENIMVKDSVGNDMDLRTALNQVRNIKGFKNISVDAVSAEKAMNGLNQPLMSGMWGSTHANYTIDLKGNVIVNEKNTGSDPKITLFNATTRKLNPNCLDGGMIHLRRLYSHVKVNVTIDKNGFNRFDNPTVEFFNIPRYTFLHEHKTVENANQYKNATWSPATHTAADLYSDGYDNPGVVLSASNPAVTFDEASNVALVMNDDDAYTVTDNGNQMTIKFGYWHYEQKHWGLSNVTKLSDRQRMHGNSDVFSSLCPSEEQDFNNNATYFVLRADAADKNGYVGRADFLIHEGFACQADGDAAATDAVAARDFSSFRNVEYTYNVTIGGLNDLSAKVNAEDMSGDFNHGAGGEIYSTYTAYRKVGKAGNNYDIYLPEGEVFWYIQEKDGEGNVTSTYGKPLDGMSADYLTYYQGTYAPPAGMTMNTGTDFYRGVTIDGMSLEDFTSTGTETKHTLHFDELDANNATLYLCAIYRPDAITTYYVVYEFSQNGLLLNSPVVTMPNAPAGNELVVGIHDHTINITKVDEATRYRIRLVPVNDGSGMVGGYEVTLAPGETNSDSDGYQTTLIDNGDGTMSYRIRYANSQKAMMNLVSNNQKQQASIEVTALDDKGKSSESVAVTKTYVKPDWHFNNTEWRQAVLGILGTQAGSFTGMTVDLKVNGLTMYSHDDSKMSYQQNGDWYDFRPGGSGTRTRCGFKFHACALGKINVWVSSASSSNLNQGRYIRVWYDGYSQNGRAESAGYYSGYYQHSEDCTSVAPGPGNATQQANGTKPLKTKDISVDPANLAGDEDNVYIFNSADFLFYHIQFTPQDR